MNEAAAAEPMKVKRQAGGRNGVRLYNVEDPDGYDYMVGTGGTDPDFVGCFQHGETCAHVDAVKAKLAKGRK